MDILLTASDSVLIQQKRIYRINQQYPRSVLSFVIDIDVLVLCLCLMESICHFEYVGPRQNIFADRSFFCNHDSVFVVVAAFAVVVGIVDYPSIQDNHVVLLCLPLVVSFYLFSD
jgi:hypothetical protein